MSDATIEHSKWVRGRTELLSSFVKELGGIASVTASRGYMLTPGFLYEAINDLEQKIKDKLSDLNYQILSETTEREIKQAGITYDLAYKTALMAWEADKQTLMDAWNMEFADIRRGMASAESVLDALMNEAQARQITLITQKTAIELSIEQYRQLLTQLGDDEVEYEVQLAEQRLLVAQKKLELIPILQQILSVEEDLLVAEREKSGVLNRLISAEEEVVAKKEELIPYINDLARVTEDYADELNVQLEIEQQIAEQHQAIAVTITEKAEARLNENTARVAYTESEGTLLDTRLAYDVTRIGADLDILNQQSVDAQVISDAETNANVVTLAADQAADAIYLDSKLTATETDIDSREDASNSITASEIHKLASIASDQVYEKERVASINAAASVTATLTHLLTI